MREFGSGAVVVSNLRVASSRGVAVGAVLCEGIGAPPVLVGGSGDFVLGPYVGDDPVGVDRRCMCRQTRTGAADAPCGDALLSATSIVGVTAFPPALQVTLGSNPFHQKLAAAAEFVAATFSALASPKSSAEAGAHHNGASFPEDPLERAAERVAVRLTHLAEEQRALLDRHDDPIMRELIKDTCFPRQLRHDVFMRGARRLRSDERDARLARLTVIPVVSPGELQTTLHVPAGKAEMSAPLKKMMAAAMRGPATIAELLALEPGRSTPPELIGVLVGSNQCQVALRSDGPQPDSADRLNRALAARVESIAEAKTSSGLASSRLGGGLPAPHLVQFIAGRLLSGEREDRIDAWIEKLSADILPEKHDKVREVVSIAVEQRVPVLRQLRIVPE